MNRMTSVGRVLNVVLTGLIIHSIYSTVLKVSGRSVDPAAADRSAVPARIEVKARPPASVAAIVGAHLFGRPGIPSQQSAEFANAPATALDLSLKGILFAEHPEDSRAIIAAGNGRHIPYAIGADIPGDARLEAMYSDRIVLRRNGSFENLYLTKTNPGGEEPVPSTPPTQTTASVQIVDQSRDQGISHLLGNIRADLIQHPEKISSLMQVEPVREKENFIGFRIVPNPQYALFPRIGLAEGDIITAVNGVRIDNPMRGADLLHELASATDVVLDVNRNDSALILKLRLAE